MLETAICTSGNYIDGGWTTEPRHSATINPATGADIALIPQSTREVARQAINAARRAQRDWASLTVWQRADYCRAIAREIDRRRVKLAEILTMEQGKPLREALMEVEHASDGFRLAAELAKQLGGETIPTRNASKLVLTIRQPRGVYAVITPWNFPFLIPVEYLGAGLVTGNTIVWLPAPTTSLCAVELTKCLAAAELPRGVINLVMGEGSIVGDELVANPGTNAVAFTGSAATGQHVAVRGAGKSLLLELGGNGPVIVFEDADVKRAAAAAAAGCFFNAGQICSASGRILVHRSVLSKFSEHMVDIAKQIALGDPKESDTTMGPLNNSAVVQKTQEHVDEAAARGAKILIGGHRRPELGSGNFYAPTVIVGVTADMLLNREETFGPVAPIIAFDTDDEAMRLAVENDYGLTAGIFTANGTRALRFALALPTGLININDGSRYWEQHLPFGGAPGKRSGLGRLGGRSTLEAMTEIKTITIHLSE